MNTPKLIGIAPQLVVPDVIKTANYYCDVLGFTLINHVLEPPVYSMVQRDGFQVHFAKGNDLTIHANEQLRKDVTDFTIWVPDIELFFEEMKSRQAHIEQEIIPRSYGREFILRDCDGHRILVVD